MCGTPDSENMSLEAESTPKGFRMSKLKRSENGMGEWKKQFHDLCYYQIYLPKSKFHLDGKLKLKFTKIDNGVDIYITSGKKMHGNSN